MPEALRLIYIWDLAFRRPSATVSIYTCALQLHCKDTSWR